VTAIPSTGPPVSTSPVLLLHGVGSSFEHNWGRSGWLDLLADEQRTTIGFELPGHGSSGRADVEHGDDLVTALLAELPKHETVDAVGFSAGGQLLAAAAAREPHRFGRIALLGVGNALLQPQPGGLHRLADQLEAGIEPTDPQARLFHRMARSAGNDPSAVARYLRLAKPRVTAADLGAISVPALVVLGDRDFAGPADQLVAALPNGRLVLLRGVDHFGLTGAAECLEVVLPFLAGTTVAAAAG
jgi:pimeloyl-ACP methyl ester carboxylesterase